MDRGLRDRGAGDRHQDRDVDRDLAADAGWHTCSRQQRRDTAVGPRADRCGHANGGSDLCFDGARPPPPLSARPALSWPACRASPAHRATAARPCAAPSSASSPATASRSPTRPRRRPTRSRARSRSAPARMASSRSTSTGTSRIRRARSSAPSRRTTRFRRARSTAPGARRPSRPRQRPRRASSSCCRSAEDKLQLGADAAGRAGHAGVNVQTPNRAHRRLQAWARLLGSRSGERLWRRCHALRCAERETVAGALRDQARRRQQQPPAGRGHLRRPRSCR